MYLSMYYDYLENRKKNKYIRIASKYFSEKNIFVGISELTVL